jgi:hypothetical protein
MTARISNITFDCDDVLKVAQFWSAALGRDLDPRSSEYFTSIGSKDATRAEPAWYFAKVPESKSAKNRVHVDIVSSEPAEHFVELGATVTGTHSVPGGSHSWTVLQDPEGNEFCLAEKAFTGWD